ncbi:MAG: cytochrome c oxidase assembly protein [Caldilineales bacterium]|nr:cytochrome c oxidase assembly protein [Caldilineales bacterium]
MSQFLEAVFTTWSFRPGVILIPAIFAILYLRGWVHLYRVAEGRQHRRRRSQVSRLSAGLEPRTAEPGRLIAYFLGLAVLLLALLSGLDAYASLLFFVHMIQHLLLIMIAPVLLWLGNPYPFLLWGLPRRMRLGTARLLAGPSTFRRVLTKVTAPGLALFYLVAATWVWHDSKLYNATLQNQYVHDFEHITFFVAGMIFWWHVTAATPRFHRRMGYLKRSLYALAPAPANMVLGVALSFAEQPLYPYYTTVPRVWDIPVMTDQMWGGVIMWLPGSMMYLMAALVLVAQHFREEEKKSPLSLTQWDNEDSFRAPGLEKSGQDSSAPG